MYMIRSFISSGAEVQNIPNKGPKRNEGDVKFWVLSLHYIKKTMIKQLECSNTLHLILKNGIVTPKWVLNRQRTHPVYVTQ